jgi:hypothetical protein
MLIVQFTATEPRSSKLAEELLLSAAAEAEIAMVAATKVRADLNNFMLRY